MDAYQKFFDDFHIGKEDFLQWGIDNTFFPEISAVRKMWDDLKKRILENGEVFIRGYGRDAHGTDMYCKFYAMALGNCHVRKDPTNNAVPQKYIEILTGKKRNKDVFNYQVSHIFGHTKNIFLFEAPWNISLTPKVMDPFTGHEAKGDWVEEYQQKFQQAAILRYREFIEEYNLLMDKCGIQQKLDTYISSLDAYDIKEIKRFESDARNELQKLVI